MSKYDEMFSLNENDSRYIVLNMIESGSKVMEFGCANGNMTRYMTEEMNCEVYIVEYDEKSYSQAITYAKDGLCGDAMQYEWVDKFGKDFDYIVFADVLEHLSDPYNVLIKSGDILKESGSVIVSVPNVAHNDIIAKLYDNRFEYTDTGLLDSTHIHFFTADTLSKYSRDAGFEIVNVNRTIIPMNSTEQGDYKLTHSLRNVLSIRSFGNVFQNIVELKKREYVTNNAIETVDSILGEDITRFCKCYIDNGNGYTEENSFFVEAKYNGELFVIKETIHFDEKIKSLRIDPIENEGCILEYLSVKGGNSEYVATCFVNALEGMGRALWINTDPQIIFYPETAADIIIDMSFAIEGTEAYITSLHSMMSDFNNKMVQLQQISDKCKLIEEDKNRQLEDKNRQLEDKNRQLEDKNRQLEDKNRQLEDKKCQIEEYRVAEKNKVFVQEITNRNLVAELDNTKNILEQTNANSDFWQTNYYGVINSKSWKLAQLIRNNKQIFRKIKNSLRKRYDVKFSILMPVYNAEVKWLKAAIESVLAQEYKSWELCIVDDASPSGEEARAYLESLDDDRIKVLFQKENKGISGATNAAAQMAKGEYLVFMDDDDIITPDALQEFIYRLNVVDADVLYSDQDIIDVEGNHSNIVCKPDWSPDLMNSQMYLGHLIAVKRCLYEKVGGLRSEFDGSQDYDLMLRICEIADRIEHISKVLYSWRSLPTSTATNPESKPYAQYAGLNAVQSHLDRVYGKGFAEAKETENLFVYDVKYPISNNVKISIIIPTKDHADDLKIAIDSIVEKSSYRNFEIVILNNNSEEKATYEYFDLLRRECDFVKVVEAFYEFNWSKLNNHGVREATGDVFVFLNNDVKVITEDWLDRLASQALLPNVGVVGPMLLYFDGTIQHAGVVAGMGGWADHVYKGMEPKHWGTPYISPMVCRNVTAVTGACMAVSRKTWDKIGTFDENYIICGSDIELCIRATQNGLYNVYNPQIKLYHYESKSRDSYIPQVDFELSYEMYKPYREGVDPYYNYNLDSMSTTPCLRGESSEEAPMEVSIGEITPIKFRKVDRDRERINILLPSLNPEHVFGGIATAYKFFKKIQECTNFDYRILLTDAAPSEQQIAKYGTEYAYLNMEDDSDSYSKAIVPISDRANKTITVSDKDYFIFTGWWTAYCIQTEYQNWNNADLVVNPFIYFIQDYEPGFYAWSDNYALADSTYRSAFKQIAVFNSEELKTFFDNNKYSFYKTYVFPPVLNDGLKKYLNEKVDNCITKKKQILVYGRPSTERNAFKIVVESLRRWTQIQDDIQEWTVISAGEKHRPVDIGNGQYLRSVGKLTIEEYAKILEESYAGLSLMVSPHPSYPPLEMSVFGAKVITNTYANKDMSYFNGNIVSIQNMSPYFIADTLNKICNDYKKDAFIQRECAFGYCDDNDSFEFVEKLVKEINDKV